MSCAALGMLLVSSLAGANAIAVPADRSNDRIDGALEPELLPEDLVWDAVFAALHALTGGKTDAADAQVDEFVRGNLFLTPEDTTALLQEVASARSTIAAIEALMESLEGRDGQPPAFAALREELRQTILLHGDLALNSLSVRGRTSLRHFVALVRSGTSVTGESASALAAGPCNDGKADSVLLSGSAANPGALQVFVRAKLNHAGAHPGCSGRIAAEATLEGDQLNADSPYPIATNSGANHSTQAQQWFGPFGECRHYRATAGFFLGDEPYNSKSSNRVRAGICAPPPPPDPTIPPPEICPNENITQPDLPIPGCGPLSPLVLDLSGNGILMSNVENGVIFDIVGPTGRPYWVAWPLTTDDLWLALDRDVSGAIEDAGELFGTATILSSGAFAEHGFEALADLDENEDGVIDEADQLFDLLLLWGDANRNGISEPTELHELSEFEVGSLSLEYKFHGERDQWGNGFYLQSTAQLTSRNGTRPLIDVYPVVEPVH